ncbi:MAG: ABC transporter permease subunit [Trebonia sp.]|jgi:ABC-type transport system involved in multi-copper enzyme maturation permease subunit
MTTMAPYRSTAHARDGFRQLLHAEWTKFRTVRGWAVGMIVAVLVTAGIGIFVAAGGASPSCQTVNGTTGQAGGCGGPTLTLGPGGEPVTDNFYLVRQPLAGNGSITVRVTSLTSLLPPARAEFGTPPARSGTVPWSKAGIIIGATSLSAPQAYAAMMVTGGNGVRMQWNYTGDTPGLPGIVSAASPRWLRLTRDGDTIKGYDSTDGVHWTVVGAVRLAGLRSTVQAGLFTASPTLPVDAVNIAGVTQGGGGLTASTGVFDHLSRTGRWPVGTWAGGYTEGDNAAEAQGIGGYRQVAGRFTVTGQGDIAPVIPYQGDPGSASGTIASYLIGTFVGLIAVAVVATMFMTGEYRRGLIRTTLAASPRRGRMLAAKALVIGAVAFAAGLLGAAGAEIVGSRIARSHGTQVFPEPWPAELRMIVGTAALATVVAVLTLAVATIVRRSVAAVTIIFVVIVVPYFLAAVATLPAGVADWLLRVTPAAAFAVQQATPRYPQVDAYYAPVAGFYPLAPWAGFAVLCAWTLVALGGAGYLLRRRDA